MSKNKPASEADSIGCWARCKAAVAMRFDGNEVDAAQKTALLLPIRLTLVYLAFTVLIYIIGPFNWITYRPVLFYGLLILYMLALWFGYRKGIRRHSYTAFEWTEDMTQKLVRAVSLLIAVNCVIYILNLFREYGLNSLNFAELWRQMRIGIMNPGLGYNLRLERLMIYQGKDVLGGYFMSLLNYAWSFVEIPIILLAMLYFRKLKPWAKMCSILYLVLVVLHYLSIGTNIRIFHIFLIAELPSIIRILSYAYRKELDWKKLCRFIACILIGLSLVACYFTWMMVSRGGINNYDDPSYNVGGIIINHDAFSTKKNEKTDEELKDFTEVTVNEATWVPPIIMKFWISFSSYLTQGYYGMSLALTESWTPMCGVGNSMFLVDFISEHITDIDSYTYSKKIEHYGWDSDMHWATMYTWLANDVSFYGVIVIMGLIGFLFAIIYKDALETENPFAKALLFYFILMLLFIPCNNQLAQSSSTLFSFVFLIGCWAFSKHIMKRKTAPNN